MATYQDWLTTNISDRLNDPNSPFIVTEKDVEYRSLSFQQATDLVVEQLPKTKLYVPLSGGMDSEYVFRVLRATPIIIDTPCNQDELTYAYRAVEELGIEPVIIKKTETELLKTFYHTILKRLNGTGYNSVSAYIAAKYAHDHGGIAVIAEHAYDGVNEWDFYNDALIGLDNSHYFLMYNREINEAMKAAYIGEDHQQFKARLYNIEPRPKFKYKYSEIASLALKRLFKGINNGTVLVR